MRTGSKLLRHRRLATRMRLVAGCAVMATLAIAAGSSRSIAAPLTLSSSPFRYTVLNQDVADALRQFGEDVHLRVSVSDAVKGRIRGSLSAATPRQFLDLITSAYALDYYFDGYSLFVTTTAEAVSKLVTIPGGNLASLDAALASSGIADPRFPLRQLAGSQQVLVSGPPRYVELVEQTADAMQPASSETESTVIFRGSAVQKLAFPTQ